VGSPGTGPRRPCTQGVKIRARGTFHIAVYPVGGGALGLAGAADSRAGNKRTLHVAGPCAPRHQCWAAVPRPVAPG
jgi:hypothetical protein